MNQIHNIYLFIYYFFTAYETNGLPDNFDSYICILYY